MDLNYGIFFITAPDKETAEKIAKGLIEARLAACVNITSVASVYRWEEKIEQAEEFLLIAKSRLGLYSEIAEYVRQNHPHEVPEVIGFPIFAGSTKYLDWLGASTQIAKEILSLGEG